MNHSFTQTDDGLERKARREKAQAELLDALAFIMEKSQGRDVLAWLLDLLGHNMPISDGPEAVARHNLGCHVMAKLAEANPERAKELLARHIKAKI